LIANHAFHSMAIPPRSIATGEGHVGPTIRNSENTMLRSGSIILTIHGCFNFLLASAILVAITAFQKSAPILYIVFGETEIPKLDGRVLAITRSLAILFNTSAVALSLLSVLVVWCALYRGQQWAFWALLVVGLFGQAMGFVADAAIGTKTLIPNLALTALFAVGIALAGYGVFHYQAQ
jgi:hypothetical protein